MYNLSVVGYETKPVFEGNAALEIIESGEHFDLALVDIMLPGIDGFELMRPLDSRNIPVIYLTAKNDIESKVRGLKGGAEDYIVKPFEIAELLARVDVVLRRCKRSDAVTTIGDLEIDLDGYEVKLKGQPVKLTSKEFEIVALLVSSPGKVFTREQILDHIWGESIGMDLRNITVLVRKIREKMEPVPSEPRYLLTVWRVGYKFASA